MKIAMLDDYNQIVHSGTDVVGSVTTTWWHLALRNGWKLIEIYETETDERGVLVEGSVY